MQVIRNSDIICICLFVLFIPCTWGMDKKEELKEVIVSNDEKRSKDYNEHGEQSGKGITKQQLRNLGVKFRDEKQDSLSDEPKSTDRKKTVDSLKELDSTNIQDISEYLSHLSDKKKAEVALYRELYNEQRDEIQELRKDNKELKKSNKKLRERLDALCKCVNDYQEENRNFNADSSRDNRKIYWQSLFGLIAAALGFGSVLVKAVIENTGA